MKTKLIYLTIAVLCLSAVPAVAFVAPTYPSVTFGTSSDVPPRSLQDVLNKITVDPAPPHTDPGDATWTGIHNSTVITTTSTIRDDWDSLWMIGGQGQSAASLVIEISAYESSNTLGIYDATDPTKMVPIFSGGASAGYKANVQILLDGSVWVSQTYPTVSGGDSGVDFAGNRFGFYLTNGASPVQTFYSETALNTADNFDHMRAYQGNGVDWVQVGSTQPGIWQTDTYILAWEDLLNGGDKDYQDFVAMIESVQPVPVPGAMLLGLLGLSAAGIKLRKFA